MQPESDATVACNGVADCFNGLSILTVYHRLHIKSINNPAAKCSRQLSRSSSDRSLNCYGQSKVAPYLFRPQSVQAVLADCNAI